MIKLRAAVYQKRLTNKAAIEKSGVAVYTFYNVLTYMKHRNTNKGKIAKFETMEAIATALELEINDIEEFVTMQEDKLKKIEGETINERGKGTE